MIREKYFVYYSIIRNKNKGYEKIDGRQNYE